MDAPEENFKFGISISWPSNKIHAYIFSACELSNVKKSLFLWIVLLFYKYNVKTASDYLEHFLIHLHHNGSTPRAFIVKLHQFSIVS